MVPTKLVNSTYSQHNDGVTWQPIPWSADERTPEHDGLHIHLTWITQIFIYGISWIIMYMRIALPLPQSQLQKCLIICYVMVMKNVFF